MTDLNALATRIETEPPTRTLADEVLLACGWTLRPPCDGCLPTMVSPQGWSPYDEERPDPLTSLDDIAALEREAGARVSMTYVDDAPDIITAGCSVPCLARDGRRFANAGATGPHAEPRARAAALVRAIAAARGERS